jgi:hypothetical protein
MPVTVAQIKSKFGELHFSMMAGMPIAEARWMLLMNYRRGFARTAALLGGRWARPGLARSAPDIAHPDPPDTPQWARSSFPLRQCSLACRGHQG